MPPHANRSNVTFVRLELPWYLGEHSDISTTSRCWTEGPFGKHFIRRALPADSDRLVH